MPLRARRRAGAARCSASVPMTTSGRRLVHALAHARAVLGAADLPRVADVAEAHVVGGVEAAARRRGSARGACGRPPRRARGAGRGAVQPRQGAAQLHHPERTGDELEIRRSFARMRCAAVRTIRLHDTRSGALRELEPRDARPGRASTPAGRRSTTASTSATRGRSSSSPCSSASSSTRATTRRSSSTSPTSTTRSTTPRAPAGVPSGELAARDDRRLRGRHRRRSGSAGPTRAAGLRDDRRRSSSCIEALIERGARLRGRRRRLLPRARGPGLRLAVAPRGRRDGPGRGRRGRGAQGGPARLRAVEGPEGGRGHVVGRAVGPRPAGLAHRVLGDGRGAARRRLRDPRRRQRPRLPPPRERGGPDARGARRRARADLDAQRDAADGRARRWPSRSATSRCCTRCSTRCGPRRADHVLLRAATTASRWPSPTTRWSRPPRAVRRIREAGAAPGRRRRRRRTWRRCKERFFDALADDFNTPRGAGGASASGSARPTARRRWATRDLREMLGVLALDEPARRRRRPRRRRRSMALAAAREEARAAKDFAEADRLRDELARRAAGRSATGPAGPSSCPSP